MAQDTILAEKLSTFFKTRNPRGWGSYPLTPALLRHAKVFATFFKTDECAEMALQCGAMLMLVGEDVEILHSLRPNEVPDRELNVALGTLDLQYHLRNKLPDPRAFLHDYDDGPGEFQVTMKNAKVVLNTWEWEAGDDITKITGLRNKLIKEVDGVLSTSLLYSEDPKSGWKVHKVCCKAVDWDGKALAIKLNSPRGGTPITLTFVENEDGTIAEGSQPAFYDLKAAEFE